MSNSVADITNKNKIIGYIGSGLLVIGNFLPFYKIDVFFVSKTITYIEGDGMLILLLGFAAAALIYFNKRALSIIPAAASLLILILAIGRLSGNNNQYGLGSFQFGIYILVIGAILVIFNALRKQNSVESIKVGNTLE